MKKLDVVHFDSLVLHTVFVSAATTCNSWFFIIIFQQTVQAGLILIFCAGEKRQALTAREPFLTFTIKYSYLHFTVVLLASGLTFSEGSFRALRSSSSSSRIFSGLLGVFFPFESPLPSEFFQKHTQCHWAAKLNVIIHMSWEKSQWWDVFKFMERNLPQSSYKQGCNRSSSNSVNEKFDSMLRSTRGSHHCHHGNVSAHLPRQTDVQQKHSW